MIKPEHSQQSPDHDRAQSCPTFFAGSLLLGERGFEWIKSNDNDKAVVAGFTIVLAISTIGLWLATIDLYRAGERQIEFLKKSSEAQSRDMRESIGAAQLAANAALKQAEISENELRIARRPWVGLSSEIPARLSFDQDGANAEFSLPIKNGGFSPARGTFIALSMLVGPIPSRSDHSAFDAEMVRERLAAQYGLPIYPREVKERSDSTGAPLLFPGEFLPLRPQKVKALRSDFLLWPTGAATVWFPLLIGYQDEFGEPHASFEILQFVSTENLVNFRPEGAIEGRLRFLGIGAPAAY